MLSIPNILNDLSIHHPINIRVPNDQKIVAFGSYNERNVTSKQYTNTVSFLCSHRSSAHIAIFRYEQSALSTQHVDMKKSNILHPSLGYLAELAHEWVEVPFRTSLATKLIKQGLQNVGITFAQDGTEEMFIAEQKEFDKVRNVFVWIQLADSLQAFLRSKALGTSLLVNSLQDLFGISSSDPMWICFRYDYYSEPLVLNQRRMLLRVQLISWRVTILDGIND